MISHKEVNFLVGIIGLWEEFGLMYLKRQNL